ncbi:hypothetical protein SAMN05216474_1567 [Lishizhenia tianjinensis]|uniref:Uncharacterized protein n=1 Tax=Lishizhenia tianjinensis TaxID=477690 RepID=A0A1I6ZRG2_9FLAO|nr:hypothetical protein [Lishizhenia tianjinensis]SFT65296.1 hypothetical protein SAMN05216474_1567 [Lishizhenia tianjinensis]
MDTQQEILHRLNALTAQLQEGKLNQLEMEELVQLSREFHERCLILRYKAIEQKVYEAKGEVVETPVEPETIVEEVADAAPASTPHVVEEKEEVMPAEGMMFDFSTPAEDENESKQNLSLNFDVTPTPEIEEKEASVEEVPTHQKVEEEKPQPQAPEVSAPKEEITKVTITQPEPINTLNNPVYNQGSFYDRFNSNEDNSLASKLGASKIASLKEAFGLNDRLQCINELFEGNKDKFESTLNSLDNLDSYATAKQQLSEVAVAMNWDLENEVVTDFVKKVERRYA